MHGQKFMMIQKKKKKHHLFEDRLDSKHAEGQKKKKVPPIETLTVDYCSTETDSIFGHLD